MGPRFRCTRQPFLLSRAQGDPEMPCVADLWEFAPGVRSRVGSIFCGISGPVIARTVMGHRRSSGRFPAEVHAPRDAAKYSDQSLGRGSEPHSLLAPGWTAISRSLQRVRDANQVPGTSSYASALSLTASLARLPSYAKTARHGEAWLRSPSCRHATFPRGKQDPR